MNEITEKVVALIAQTGMSIADDEPVVVCALDVCAQLDVVALEALGVDVKRDDVCPPGGVYVMRWDDYTNNWGGGQP